MAANCNLSNLTWECRPSSESVASRELHEWLPHASATVCDALIAYFALIFRQRQQTAEPVPPAVTFGGTLHNSLPAGNANAQHQKRLRDGLAPAAGVMEALLTMHAEAKQALQRLAATPAAREKALRAGSPWELLDRIALLSEVARASLSHDTQVLHW